MASILAIETSTPACSVALSVDGARFSRYSEEPRSHTRLIMTMIDEVLAEAGLKIADLDALAVSIGPGSFTGLRIGFATVQGLAFGADLPVIPVSTLEVMAQTYQRKHASNTDLATLKQSAVVMAVLDARMGEFNCGAYQLNSSGQFEAVTNDQLLGQTSALEMIDNMAPQVIVGDVAALLDDKDSQQLAHQQLYPDAIDLLDIALSTPTRHKPVPVTAVELVYLRGTEAWKKHTKLRAG
jgi:tRNA threonylcarbamoyladenosine biosynthesis protein TsaB